MNQSEYEKIITNSQTLEFKRDFKKRITMASTIGISSIVLALITLICIQYSLFQSDNAKMLVAFIFLCEIGLILASSLGIVCLVWQKFVLDTFAKRKNS